MNQYDIAEKFGLSQPAVSRVITRKTWADVPDEEEAA